MNNITYLDFDLLIQRVEEGYRAQVLNSPAGQASVTFLIPFSDIELENFLLKVGRPRRGTRGVGTSEVNAAKTFGERLFASVFNGEVRGCLRSSLDEARRQDSGLRIRLRLTEVPELVDLPWEYLYSPPPINRFLALSNKTPIVRYLDLPELIRPLVVTPPLRMLVMISSPRDYANLDVEREWANLCEALGDVERRGLVKLERLEKATAMALQRQLRQEQYHIFHFIGHGGFDTQNQDGQLVLEDDQEKGSLLSAQYLGALLHDHYAMRLVVLNACEGGRNSSTDPFAGTAQSLIQQGVPAVVAMQFEITDDAAISLAREFYGALADGYPVDAALSEARKTIFTQGNGLEWGTPVLYLRSSDGRIFDIKEMSDAERSQLRNTALYRDAQTAMVREDWPIAIEKLQELLVLTPSHAEASIQLNKAREQKELAALYASALELDEANRWNEALQCFHQLQKKRPDYKDVAARIEYAQHELARMSEEERKQTEVSETLQRNLAQANEEEQRRNRIAALYSEAQKALDKEEWPAAIEKLQDVLALDASQSSAKAMLDQAKRQQELESLYVNGCRLHDAGKWQDALSYFYRVQNVVPHYKDVATFIAGTKRELAKLPQEYKETHSIPEDRRHNKARLWLAIGGVAILLTSFLIVVNQSRWWGEKKLTPTSVSNSNQASHSDPSLNNANNSLPIQKPPLVQNDSSDKQRPQAKQDPDLTKPTTAEVNRTSKLIRKSSGVLAGLAVSRVEPVYPTLAKAAGVSGVVIVEVTIDEGGNVISARSISGHPLLKDAAEAAARGWKFSPTYLSGLPVKVIGTISFNFSL